ncbi:hypothetical protein [Massilia aerilata]|uniref:DUF2846 domain-containing protein n=1 Tax=Massilia aerilata TaxID=453817 RepID=A0ABW0RSJ9_9BURK
MRVLLCLFVLLLGCAGCASNIYPRKPTSQEMANAEGLYGLQDGYRAHIFELDSRLYVRIGAHQQKELQLAGPEHFVSKAGDVSIQFQPEREEDDAERVVVEYARAPGGHPPVLFSTGPRPGRSFVD